LLPPESITQKIRGPPCIEARAKQTTTAARRNKTADRLPALVKMCFKGTGMIINAKGGKKQ